MIYIQEPSPGQKLSATWGRNVVRALKELRIIGGNGVIVTSGPNGTTISAKSAARAGGSKTVAGGGLPGCFIISSITPVEEENQNANDDDEKMMIEFANPYLMIGGRLHMCESRTITVKKEAQIVAVKASATVAAVPILASYASVEALQGAQADLRYYISPLYRFDSNLGVVCDFRNMQTLAQGEY